MKESERLIAAKALIDSPERWTQKEYCDKKDNLATSCKFCSIGAVLRVRGDRLSRPDMNSTSSYLGLALNCMGLGRLGVAEYNDSHTHAEVMQMFDKAIQLAQAEGN